MARASCTGLDCFVEGRHVDQMQQQAGARQMAQELVTQAGAFGGAFDQAGNVGDHEAAFVIDAHHAQVGMQRGEGVIRNFRLGRDTARMKVDLPALGMPSRPTSASTFSSSRQFQLFALLARRALARRAVGAGFEVQVAEAALAALGDQGLLAVDSEVGNDFAGCRGR